MRADPGVLVAAQCPAITLVGPINTSLSMLALPGRQWAVWLLTDRRAQSVLARLALAASLKQRSDPSQSRHVSDELSSAQVCRENSYRGRSIPFVSESGHADRLNAAMAYWKVVARVSLE